MPILRAVPTNSERIFRGWRLLCMRGKSQVRERMSYMKKMRMLMLILTAVLLAPALPAQEKPGAAAASDSAPSATAYRVQVVISEYDGATKVSSLPYSIPVAPVLPGDTRAFGSMRTGIRVPVAANSKPGENGFSYVDVGTNLDVRVRRPDAERYSLELTVEHSWLYVREKDKEGNAEGRAWAPGDPAPGSAPLIHTFRTNVQFLLRDAHSAETTMATDPVTGHVFKVDAQLTVLK